MVLVTSSRNRNRIKTQGFYLTKDQIGSSPKLSHQLNHAIKEMGFLKFLAACLSHSVSASQMLEIQACATISGSGGLSSSTTFCLDPNFYFFTHTPELRSHEARKPDHGKHKSSIVVMNYVSEIKTSWYSYVYNICIFFHP